MAIALTMELKGATVEQYDQVNEKLGITDRAPEGCLFHWVARTDDGICINDVWETREQFEAFGQKLGPIMGQIGYTGHPETTFTDVYNYLNAPQPSSVG